MERWHAPGRLCLAQPVERNTRRTVRHIYDTGALKPGLGNGALHGQIVLVRVDTQMVGALLGKGKHRSSETMRGVIGSHAM